MENNPIENFMKTTMENIKDMVDVNTIVGTPIESKDGSLILPISKVSFGFVAGGSEFANCKASGDNPDFPFGGGSGAGVTVKPVAFLVIKSDSLRLLSLDQKNSYDKVIDSMPQIIDAIKDMPIFKDKKNNKKKDKKDQSKDDQCKEEE
ncbi:GerW family sporulation protein [Haloimpatiens lingqiaonensis]|uniref:GerW family sporulation protein n=1 Tax=Haloimpatiens lingqiaonensis TaxID=1380675 RepID=UPI0010FD1E66|nr:GerW family sporulation protein [Haloimpatiens lingqiaonensis]